MEYKSLPDMKALATLREIVERGGVAEAGRALSIGQPAVTKRLRALERSFNIELMVREAGRLRLTTAGERVYAFARLVMEHQLELLGDLNQLRAGRDRLRLAVTQSIGEHLLPDLLLAFGMRFDDRVTGNPKTYAPYAKKIHIDMTPMVDVAFLLLIFFMTTTQFKPPEVVAVTLPASRSEIHVPETDTIILTVNREGRVFISTERVADAEEVPRDELVNAVVAWRTRKRAAVDVHGQRLLL